MRILPRSLEEWEVGARYCQHFEKFCHARTRTHLRARTRQPVERCLDPGLLPRIGALCELGRALKNAEPRQKQALRYRTMRRCARFARRLRESTKIDMRRQIGLAWIFEHIGETMSAHRLQALAEVKGIDP